MSEFLKVAGQGDPELALLAAVVRCAFDDAAEGDLDARRWLTSEHCAACLGVFTDADPAILQRALIAKLPVSYQAKLDWAA